MQELQVAGTDKLKLQEQLKSASAQHKAEIAALQGANAALQVPFPPSATFATILGCNRGRAKERHQA